MENKFSVHYQVVRQWNRDPFFGKIPVYTIFGRNSLGEKQRSSRKIYDRGLALRLVRLLNRNEVSLLHTEDVIADLLSGEAVR